MSGKYKILVTTVLWQDDKRVAVSTVIAEYENREDALRAIAIINDQRLAYNQTALQLWPKIQDFR
jgi:hypothetical protein